MSSVSAAGSRVPERSARGITRPQRIRPPRADRDETVVADLDHLAHLPERLDREVAAALEVIPLTPPGEGRDQRRVVHGHDRRAEHEAGRIRLADLEQGTAPKAIGARNALGPPRAQI